MEYKNKKVKSIAFSEETEPELYIFFENDAPIKEKYDEDLHKDMLSDYLIENGANLTKSVDENEEAEIDAELDRLANEGVFFRFDPNDTDTLNHFENLFEFETEQYAEPENNPEEDYEDTETKHLSKGAKGAIASGVVAAMAIGGAGIYHHSKTDKKDVTDKLDSKLDSKFMNLMNEFDEKDPTRILSESVFNSVKEINTNTSKKDEAVYKTNEDGTKEYLFSLATDKSFNKDGKEEDEYLQFTFDELVAAKLVLNDFTEEELYKIFNDSELDKDKLMNDYESFASKVLIYYMNAKAPSGIAKLIENEDNRKWFEEIENNILAFNKDINSENADKVIRATEYLFEYDINGSDNMKTETGSINAVKNLAYHMVSGYQLANSASDEYTKYLKVSSEPGEYDKKFQEVKLAQVQKGEKLADILERAGKENCSLSSVEKQIEGEVERLTKQQSETTSKENLLDKYKADLAEILISAGNAELASRVLYEEMSDELRDLIKKEGKEATTALEAYDTCTEVKALPTFAEIKVAADEELGPYDELNITLLVANRQRGKVLDLEKDNTDSKTVSKDQWNKMSSKEKVAYAKENGKVVKEETKTSKTKVSEKDLTPEEKKSVEKQKEDMKLKDGFKVKENDNNKQGVEVEVDLSTYNGQGAKAGYTWATSGSYTYNGNIVNDINPDYPTTVYTKGTTSNFYNVARLAYAYEGITLKASESDSSIKNALNKDLNNFKANNSNSKAIEAYKEGWLEGVEAVLESAVKSGKLERSKAEQLYKEAQNKQSSKEVVENITTEKEETKVEEPKKQDEYRASEEPVNDKNEGKFEEDPELNTDTSGDIFIEEEGEGFHYLQSSNVEAPLVGEAPKDMSIPDDYYEEVVNKVIEEFDKTYTASEESPKEEKGPVLVKQ